MQAAKKSGPAISRVPRNSVTPSRQTKRVPIPEQTTRILLVRCGGRCAICYCELMTSTTTWKDVYLGERAHIVGRSTNFRSPRGNDPLKVSLRDDPENLLLLCPKCHADGDYSNNLDVLTVSRLMEIKRRHEARIRQILEVPPDNQSVVLRVHGMIGASGVHIDRSTAARAALANNKLVRFSLSHDISGIEIDLRHSAYPDAGNANYYAACRTAIDAVFDRQLLPAFEAGQINHLSVFALARWPLLVYLGTRIGDKVTTDVYQRHRSTEDWSWPETSENVNFDWSVAEPSDSGDAEEAVLVLSVSANVQSGEVPQHLQRFATYRIDPVDNVTPNSDIIATQLALASATAAVRSVLFDIEKNRKSVKRLHILGAAPLSLCVSLGRSISLGIHPTLSLYDRVEGNYQIAMEINR